MTREEAIKILKSTLAYDSDFAEAKQMAIEALEQEPTAEYSSDVISRQATIDAFDGVKVDEKTEYDIGYNDGIDFAVSKLSVLPSADRPKGRWEMKPDPYGFFDEIPVCSECGCTTKMRESYKFCPNCGSYNGGGEE